MLTAGTGGAIPGGADVGDDLEVGADGTLVVPAADSEAPVVGKVIAKGYEVKKGAKGASVKKLLCQLSF